MSIHTCCATRSHRIYCNPLGISARCRSYWVTRASPVPRCTRTSTSSTWRRSTTRPIRAPEKAARSARRLKPRNKRFGSVDDRHDSRQPWQVGHARVVAVVFCWRRAKKTGRFEAPRKATEEKLERNLPGLLHPLAVKTYVETFAFLFFGDAQADHHVDDLEDDETTDPGDCQSRTDGAKLDHEVGVRAADVLDVEHAGQQGADNAADAVHAESVERIVVVEHFLDVGRREKAEHARCNADDKCTRDADKARRRCDRQKPGNCA